MNKLFLTTIAFFGVALSVNAQDISDHAIGLRLGDSDGFGAEITYQHALSNNNRLEADLGWRTGDEYKGFKLTGLYQWVWVLDGDFNWYAGAGGGIGSYNFESQQLDDETFMFVAGDIGVEYNFDIPLLLSLDFRPEIGFSDYSSDLGFDIALGIKYKF